MAWYTMIPGMNMRKAEKMMRKMGIQQVEVPATEVIIKTPDKELIISEPQVSKVNMMGQETFQVVGNVEEKPVSTEPEINEDDIKTVMGQASVDEKRAKEVLKETQGNIAEAILKLKQ